MVQGARHDDSSSGLDIWRVHTWQNDGHGIFIKVPVFGPIDETTNNVPLQAAEEIATIVAELNLVLEEQDQLNDYSSGYLVGFIDRLKNKINDHASLAR